MIFHLIRIHINTTVRDFRFRTCYVMLRLSILLSFDFATKTKLSIVTIWLYRLFGCVELTKYFMTTFIRFLFYIVCHLTQSDMSQEVRNEQCRLDRKRFYTLPFVFHKNRAHLYQSPFLFQTLFNTVIQLSTSLVI